MAEALEVNLELVGATAIEDKLQEEVPEVIASLRQAGMRVWVLTGDKLETAINIGFSSNLLTTSMQLWRVRGTAEAEEAIEIFFAAASAILGRDISAHGPSSRKAMRAAAGLDEEGEGDEGVDGEPLGEDFDPLTRGYGPGSGEVVHALVVDGLALKHILDDARATRYLLRVAAICRSVICCRVSPLQKAQVVHLVRRGHRSVCLSIGDGANDVSMLQEADVGVAITGEEGLQAAMASDYTIGQFRFLKPLLIVHGQWSYLRVAEMILNFFWKNVFYALTVFYYQIFCGFSANLFYDYTYVSLYNLVFTVAPVVVLGCTDQAVSAEYALLYPGLYGIGIRQERYSMKKFWLYIVEAIADAALCFFIFYGTHTGSGILGVGSGGGGPAETQIGFSSSVATAVILCATLWVGMNTYSWNWFMHVFIALEAAIALIYLVPWHSYPRSTLFGVAGAIYGQPSFWFGLALSLVLVLGPRFVVLSIKQWLWPNDLDVVRERQKYHLDDRRIYQSQVYEVNEAPSSSLSGLTGSKAPGAGLDGSGDGRKASFPKDSPGEEVELRPLRMDGRSASTDSTSAVVGSSTAVRY